MMSQILWMIVMFFALAFIPSEALTNHDVPRRAFVSRSVATLLSTATVVALKPSEIVQAASDDLSMPSAQDAKDLDEVRIVSAFH